MTHLMVSPVDGAWGQRGRALEVGPSTVHTATVPGNTSSSGTSHPCTRGFKLEAETLTLWGWVATATRRLHAAHLCLPFVSFRVEHVAAALLRVF